MLPWTKTLCGAISCVEVECYDVGSNNVYLVIGMYSALWLTSKALASFATTCRS